MEHLVREFWKIIDEADFDRLREVLAADVSVVLPNTREVFEGRESYITFNKMYPGRWRAEVERLDRTADTVITSTKIQGEESSPSFYVVSYFKVTEGLLSEITEYWGQNSAPPPWRIDQALSRRY